jgi:hypothetical protein
MPRPRFQYSSSHFDAGPSVRDFFREEGSSPPFVAGLIDTRKNLGDCFIKGRRSGGDHFDVFVEGLSPRPNLRRRNVVFLCQFFYMIAKNPTPRALPLESKTDKSKDRKKNTDSDANLTRCKS